MADALLERCEGDDAPLNRQDHSPTPRHTKGLSHRFGQNHATIIGHTNIKHLVHFRTHNENDIFE